MLTIRDLVDQSHQTAVEKGWWEKDRDPLALIALMHSELSEALEELRKMDCVMGCYMEAEKPEGVGVELADVIIRIADFCGRHEIDLEECLRVKMDFNKSRPYKHGKRS